MPKPGGAVQVEGLKAFRKALQEADTELTKELRRELREVAKIAESAIRAAVPVGPNRGGHWRSDIKAGTSGTIAYVTWGRSARPYAPWLEFGGAIRRPRPVSGGYTEIRRPRTPEGRYVYPTVERLEPVLERQAARALDRVLRKADLE